jgi:hypothetical protein
MRTIPFNSFPTDEQEIFQSSCVRWGKKLRDFVVTADEPDSPDREREVTVTYVPSARARSYRAGDGARWIGEFEDDLQLVYFGRMPQAARKSG